MINCRESTVVRGLAPLWHSLAQSWLHFPFTTTQQRQAHTARKKQLGGNDITSTLSFREYPQMTSLPQIVANLYAWTWCTWHYMRSSLTAALAPAAGRGRAQGVLWFKRLQDVWSLLYDRLSTSVSALSRLFWCGGMDPHLPSLNQFIVLVKKTPQSKRWPLRTTHMIITHFNNNKNHHAELITLQGGVK